MPIVIQGFTASSKTPGAVSQVEYAAGFSSIGSNPRYCLVVGTKSSGGTATVNVPVAVFSESDGRTLAGARSEGARMIAAALAVPGVALYYLPVAEAGGATAATLVVTITGPATASGSFDLHFGDASQGSGVQIIQVPIANTETATVIGARLESLVDEKETLYCAAANVTGTVTLTVTSLGIRGNQHVVFLDKSKLPTGVTVALTGGTVLVNGGVPFSGGTGTEDVATALVGSEPGKWDYVGVAQNDATNLGKFMAQANAKAGPFEARPENVIAATGGTLAASTTLTQTNMNEALGQMVWFEGARNHPSEIAAQMAAYRSVVEATAATDLGDPNHRYDGERLPTIAGYYDASHVPGRSQTDAALNVGLTPIGDANGRAVIVRSITSRSLSGAQADYRVLDTGDAVVPQRIREYFDAKWTQGHAPSNPYVSPDPPNGEAPPQGVSTPSLWRTAIMADLPRFQRQNLITDLANNQPAVEYSSKRLMSSIPIKVTPQNHQTGTLVRQIPS